jgi:hypothetical protein
MLNTFSVRVIRNVRIPMPDGVTLAADLHMPALENKSDLQFPAIIEYTPYHKNNNAVYGPRATRYPYFASQGYVFVNVDIRGTGDSGGFNTSFTSPEEVRDGLEVIRWCARQPWCDGNVGMIGISYTAGVCYDAARQAPPELKAIILCQMTSDWYTGMACPGGSPRPFAYENYAPLMAAYNFAPPNPDFVGDEWRELWQQRLENSVPWGKAYIENLLDGPFFDAQLLRGREAEVRAATFLIGGWCDWYPDDLLRVFSRLKCPKRILIGPWTHNYPENAWPLPRINDRYECLRWFDKYLKGIDTDVHRPLENEPPITLFVREFTTPAALRREDAGNFQHETEWPPRHTSVHQLYLDNNGKLVNENDADPCADSLTYRADAGIAAGRYVIGQMLPGWGMPDDQRLDEGQSLVYTSEPIEEDSARELIGAPHAHLWLSSTAELAFVSVKLCDVAPDGTSVLVTKGVLNLTHRSSHERPQLLLPGDVYEIDLPLLAAAYRFRPGHRMRMMIAAADFQNAWPTPVPHTLSVHRGATTPSQVVLPLGHVRSDDSPVFRASDFLPLPQSEIPTPQYQIIRDLVRSTVTVEIRTLSGIGVNRSRYTVDVNRPAFASVESEFEYRMDKTGMAILVHAQCVTHSDEQSFHHMTSVAITMNGQPYWQKSWSTSVPRVGC